MEKLISDYFDATALRREYLIGDAFLAKYTTISRDFIWQEQNERFKRLLARAWRMQFYRRLWGEHGVRPGDIRSLFDIEKLPVFDEDRRAFDDFTGRDSYAPGLAPPVDHFFGPRGTEIKHLLFARAALFQGEREDAIAQFLACPQANRNEMIAHGQNHSSYGRYHSEAAGLIAIEGLDRDGLYIMEDAQYVEVVSQDRQIAAIGTPGELVLTSLYKDDIAPLIRFNTHDIASIRSNESKLGLNLRRIQHHQP